MDLVLSISDDLILDRVWAALVPMSAFDSSSTNAFYASATNLTSSSSLKVSSILSWSDFVSWAHLPHPQLPSSNYTPPAFIGLEYASAWPRDYIPRQLLSLTVLTLIGICFLYFIFAGLSYRFIFNHEMMKHPRFLDHQVRLEIETSLRAFPGMTMLTLPWFQAEVMGYSKLYDDVGKYGWGYFFFSILW